MTTCNTCGNEQSSRNDSRFCAFCGAELFARPVSEPRPATVRSPWWEEIDAPPPRVTAPSLPVPAAAPAEPITAPLTMNAVPLVASTAPSMRSPSGDTPLSPESVVQPALVPEEGPSSEAHAPATALLDAALAAAAEARPGPVVEAPTGTDEPPAPVVTESAPQAESERGVEDLPSPPATQDGSVPSPSEGALAPGELEAVAAPHDMSQPSSDAPVNDRTETPTVTLHVPFGGQDEVPTATLTWPGLAPARLEPSEAAPIQPSAPTAEPARADASEALPEPEPATVEVPAVEVPPVEVPAVQDVSLKPRTAERDAPVRTEAKADAASSATPDPVGVGLISPSAGSHGSLADTRSRFLPTPSELRSVRMPAPNGSSKAAQPKSVVAAAGDEDEWASLNESERDLAEFQSLFRARFGRPATASVDGNMRLHRPVIAFERQLAARRQLERPSEGGSAMVSRAVDRATTNGSAEVRRPAEARPRSGDTSFGSTGIRRGTVDSDPADELLPTKEAVELRPFRVPTPDAPAPRVEQVQTQSWSPVPPAQPTPPSERPLVVGDDDIPDLPSDWKPRQ